MSEAREYQALVWKLFVLTEQMMAIGENDMGVLSLRLARRFHHATDSVRRLTEELTEDVLWPHEPGIPGCEEWRKGAKR